MSVYVDPARHKFGRMVMCHMAADTLGELHAMADLIGVARCHFQSGRVPHFDICKAKRRLAVRAGAIEVSSRELVSMFRRPVAYAVPAPTGEQL